jgi:predicted DCC family thiol-disulfide oxidoreductase YuxK
MISLASEMTDRKGRHARGWLFYDAGCEFCARTAGWLARPLYKRGLAVAPLQDPRVASLLGIPAHELLQAIRLVLSDGKQYAGADAFLALARELWWARPVIWMSKVPGGSAAMRAAYEWVAKNRRCSHRRGERCVTSEGEDAPATAGGDPSAGSGQAAGATGHLHLPCKTGEEGLRP